jgi:hypothetical protein
MKEQDMSWKTIHVDGNYSLEDNSGEEYYFAKSDCGNLIQDSFQFLCYDRQEAMTKFNEIVTKLKKEQGNG